MSARDQLVAREGDTFPCAQTEPHPTHLHWHGVRVYACDGDTDTRRTADGRRPR